MNELKLDMHSLDEAWLQQPELSHKYGVQLLEAEMLRTRLKDKLDITKAEIDLEIRENVTPKPTESAINSLIFARVVLVAMLFSCLLRPLKN